MNGLVIGIGNRSRGDDALGPLCLDGLSGPRSGLQTGPIDALEAFQLQVENACDLEGRPWVVFIDAATRLAEPFVFSPIGAARDASTFSHALSPAALLAHAEAAGYPIPPCWQLAIRGEAFELGEALTQNARAHLTAARAFLNNWIDQTSR